MSCPTSINERLCDSFRRKGKSMQISSLSQHFVKRWRQRVGAIPTVAGVNRILASAQQTRRQEKLFAPDHVRGLRLFKLLAEYWNPRAGVIIRVDEDNRRAVTVFTAARVRIPGRAQQQRESEHEV